MSRLFFVFSYTTLKLVPGIVTRNLAVQDFDDNFRPGMNESGHAQLGVLEIAAFFTLRSSSEKFRNHCVKPTLSTSNEPSSKAEKGPQSNLPWLMMRLTRSRPGGSVSTRSEEQFRPALGSR